MGVDALTIYESWDLRRPIIPLRTHLYQLEPVGIGTTLVESLTSFVARLAQAHCILPGVLISREVAPLVSKVYRTRNLFGIRDWTGGLNGTGTMALDLIMVLEALTLRSDLRFLTLLTWANVLPQRKLLRCHQAWCPNCYEDWRSTQQVIYEPLLWSIDVVTVCPRHRRRLCRECPHCTQPLPLLAPYSRPGYCSRCGAWLGTSVDSEPFSPGTVAQEELMWQTWVTNSLGELLAAAPLLPKPLPGERVAQAFQVFVKQITEGNIAAFARMLQIPKNQVWMWHRGKVLPQLNRLLTVCYCLDLSLLDFLSLEVVEATFSPKLLFPLTLVADKSRKTLDETFDLNKVRQVLEHVLQKDEKPPPPMTEVARQLGHDRRVIRRHFPSLCRAIAAKYILYKSSSRVKRIRQCCEQIQQIVKKLDAQGVQPSEAHVSKLLERPGCFRDQEIRGALREARRQLGLEP